MLILSKLFFKQSNFINAKYCKCELTKSLHLQHLLKSQHSGLVCD